MASGLRPGFLRFETKARRIRGDGECLPSDRIGAIKNGSWWLLLAPVLTSTLDRFGAPVLVLTIASTYGVGVADAVVAVSLYGLLYGLGQPAWGMLADRLGRVRTMRLALLGAGLAGLASASAPTLAALVVLRALSGTFFGAINPTAMVYVADATPVSRRRSAVAELISVASVGTALGPLLAATTSEVWTWRVMFATAGIVAVALAVMLGWMPDAVAAATQKPGVQLARVLHRPRVLVVSGLGLCEGAAVLGAFPYLSLATQLDVAGGDIRAGVVLALYGLATVVGTSLVKVVDARSETSVLLFLGAGLAALGYGAASVRPNLAGALFASLLAGGAFAFLHSSLITWASDVDLDMRATAVSLFVASVFVGGAITTAGLANLAEKGDFRAVFAVPAVVATATAYLAPLLHRRYGF
jgi:predicted MFS family arabinose efflux permease